MSGTPGSDLCGQAEKTHVLSKKKKRKLDVSEDPWGRENWSVSSQPAKHTHKMHSLPRGGFRLWGRPKIIKFWRPSLRKIVSNDKYKLGNRVLEGARVGGGPRS